jgi:ribosomal protein S18 acetylase RimI-like enzyme
VAELDGRVVGMTSVRLTPSNRARANLFAMWVEPAARRRGVARAILEAAVSWAESKGAREMDLRVTETNEAATRLYRTAGFRDAGEREVLRSGSPLYTRLMILGLRSRITE